MMHIRVLMISGIFLAFVSGSTWALDAFAPTVYHSLAPVVESQGIATDPVVPPAGLAWYKFAYHTHTLYSSDASATVERRIRGAAAEGADVVSITDHGNMNVYTDPMFTTLDGCVPMLGEEWGSEIDGDAGLLNPTPGSPIGGARVPDMIPLAQARGATIIANHPYNTSEPWRYTDLHLGIQGIETLNTPVYILSGYPASVDWWNGFLARGRIVFGIGGSDNHTDSAFSLSPCNYVLSASTNPDDMQDAIEAGHITTSQTPSAGHCFIWCDTDDDGTYETPLGTNITIAQQQTIRFRVDVYGTETMTLLLFSKEGQLASLQAESGQPWTVVLEASVNASTKDFLRAEVRTENVAYPLESITNPIYINYRAADIDSDGIEDASEEALGTDKYAADSDGDGVADLFEISYDGDAAGYDPYDPDTNPTGKDLNATVADSDGDGFSDSEELRYGSDPLDALSVVPVPAQSPCAQVLLCAFITLAGCLFAIPRLLHTAGPR